mgnify:CR=1 FL=1
MTTLVLPILEEGDTRLPIWLDLNIQHLHIAFDGLVARLPLQRVGIVRRRYRVSDGGLTLRLRDAVVATLEGLVTLLKTN